MKETIKSIISIVTNLSTLVVAITILISVPNSLSDYLKTRKWEENINILRFSSDDYLVIYNGNPKPVFINRYEYTNHKVKLAGSGEINQTIPPYSYLNYKINNDNIKWDKMFKGDDLELRKIIQVGLNKLNTPYKFVFYNDGHPTLKLLSRTSNYPRVFDFNTLLTVNFEKQEKMIPIQSKGIIIEMKKD